MRPYPTRSSTRQAERRVEQRNRRVTLIGGASVVLAFVVALAFLVIAPTADAISLSKPRLIVVGGNRAVAVSWRSVPGAASYDVSVRRHGATSGKTVTTTGDSALVTGLANGVKYDTTVTATASATGPTATSASVTRTTTAAMPNAVTGVKVTGAGLNRVTVSWTGGGPTNRVAVIAGSTSMTDQNHFASAWMPGAVHSITLTVPAKLQAVLGSGSGNYVFAKVVQSNSIATDPAKGMYFDGQALYRPSASGSYGLAGTSTSSSATKVSVASWNVQSITSSARFATQNQWAARVGRVVANIESVKPDLIGMQELTTARTDATTLVPNGDACANGTTAGTDSVHTIMTNPNARHCTEMYETLQTRLTGYQNARTDAWRWLYTTAHSLPGAYVDSALFYNPAKLVSVDSGFISPQLDLKVTGWGSRGDEAGMWAEFHTKVPGSTSPGRSFLAASIHLPVGADAATKALRQREAAALSTWLDAKSAALGGMPIVLVGDFNSNGQTDSTAANLVFRAKGYFDAASTTHRTGARWSTSNATNGPSKDGYPTTATEHPYPTSRIDYILTKGAPDTYSYANLVRLTANGAKFDQRYNGSDHNLQLASIGIPG